MNSGPIEDYLDDLLRSLCDRPRQARHLLAEAEAHLRDDAAAGVAAGLDPEAAERDAVARFGPVSELAALEARRSLPFDVVVRQVVCTGLLLTAIGGVAIGLSAIPTAIMGSVGGNRFIIDVQAGQHLSPADCARWLAADHAAHTCAQAAIADWAGEIVGERVLCGMLGLLALGGYVVVRRRWVRRRITPLLPAVVIDAVAASSFAVAAVWLFGLGVDALTINSGHGAGQWLGAAPIALLATGWFAVQLFVNLRQPSATGP